MLVSRFMSVSTLATFSLLAVLLTSHFVAPHHVSGEDSWTGFLGNGGNPVAKASLPSEFAVETEDSSATNIAWRVALPGRSVSGPIVVDGKVITTSSSGMEERWLNVAAVDSESGELLWHRSSKATGRPFCHPTSANAAPTPCTDGERVFAFYSSNDFVCYDLDGNLQWFKSLTDSHPLAGNDVGMAASPAVIDGVVVVAVECQADSFATGIDAQTGLTLWEVSRPNVANWASPRALKDSQGNSAIVLQGRNGLEAVDPKSGSSLWKLELDCSGTATSVAKGDALYVPGGGVQKLEFSQVANAPEKSWNSTRLNPSSASLVATDVGVVGLNRSILVCVDDEGERLWNARLEDAGQIWATPVATGNRLYVFSMSGKCFTVEFDSSGGKVIAESELGSEVLGSPAIADDALFVRSVDALWKIAQ